MNMRNLKIVILLIVSFTHWAAGAGAACPEWPPERMSAEKELTGIETKIEMAKQAVQKQAETLEQLNADRKKLGQEDSDIQQKLDMLKEFSIKKNQKLAVCN